MIALHHIYESIAADPEFQEFPIELMLANTLDRYVMTLFQAEPDFIAEYFLEFEAYVKKYHPTVKISSIYNSAIYNWYFGNVLEMLVNLLFHAPIKLIDEPIMFTRQQIQTIILLIYRLIVEHDVDPTTPDYYEQTVYEYIASFHDKSNIDADQIRFLMFVVKHGKNVPTIQKDLVKIYRARKLQRQKKAVGAIETWWFEIINSPYTPVGSKMMSKRAVQWQAMAKQ